MTAQSLVDDAAAVLRDAQLRLVAIEPLTISHPGLTVDDAWQIQAINRERRLASGLHVLGYKCGLTSPAMQEQMGVGEPDFGVLLSDMRFGDGGVLQANAFVQPRIEAEIALVLAADLGAGTTADDVLGATAHAHASLEIIDSRIKDWRLTLVDTVADNASSGAFVLGEAVDVRGHDLAEVEVVVKINGVEVATGLGSAALGNPALAAAWLANRLAEFGTVLSAGSVIMTGSLHASLPISAGDDVSADFSVLGATSLRVR